MDGTSQKGEHQFNIPSSARSLLKNEYSEAFETLSEHCTFLDKRVTTLSSQLETLERLLQDEQTKRHALETELAAFQRQQEQQQTDEVQSQFLDTMSHELRTPLNGILGMAQLMLSMPLSSELKDYTEAIMDSGKSLNGIIGSLLDFSRLSQGDFKLQPQPFNLLSCLEELIANHAITAIKKGIGISLLPTRDLRGDVTLDPKCFKQIIGAVIDNAIKFTDHGHISIKAHLKPLIEDKNPSTLVVQIQDTGIGITPEHLAVAYKPFWQADQTNARKHGGIGMGLSLSRKLLSLMGGEINIDSSIGEGTRCTIQFPLNAPVISKEIKPAKRTPALRVGFFKLHEADQQVLEEYLDWLGFESTCIQPTCVDQSDEPIEETPAPLDLVITPLNDVNPQDLNALRSSLAEQKVSPLFASLVSPVRKLTPAAKRQFDVLIPYPILYPSLKSALNFAAETLKSQKSSPQVLIKGTSTSISTSVLLIEPNKINQKILTHILESLELDVDVVDSISSALTPSTVQSNQQVAYSTILINTMLQPTPEPEALHELLNSLSLTDNHKLIGIQGKNTGKPAQVYAEAGVNAFLTLPTSIDQVRKLILGTETSL